MAQITASLVKELREKSGVGMMDCKKALSETDGDIESAVDWLRKKGLSSAAKKAGRIAAEGLVGVAINGNTGAIVEVNSETDFVARNEVFQEFVSNVAQVALDVGDDLDVLGKAACPGTDKTISEQLTHLISTIGENMQLRRVQVIRVDNGVVAPYIHNAVAPGLGKIGVLVAIATEGDHGKGETLGKQIAMHVAAARPSALSRNDVDTAMLERERSVLADQARASGKPEEIIEKMVEGRLRKYYEEVCLLEQVYVIDGENSIAKVLEANAGDIGAPVTINQFVRFELGEGVEKKEDDFAAEVAAAAGS